MGKNKIVLTVFGIILLLIIIYFLQDTWLAKQPTSQPKTTSVIQTKIYTDPAGYFSMKIPSTMQTTVNVATNTTGLKTNHPATQNIEIVTHMINGAGVTIQVYENKPTCQEIMTPNTTIAGFPATYDVNHLSYTIQTGNATYVLYSFYPGSGNVHAPNNYKPQLTQQQKDAYEKSLKAILQTFHPTSTQKLSC
jgi:hypothetical protein